jgi:methyl-accepting chemotaxis protein
MFGLQLGVKNRIYGGFGILVVLGLTLALFACWQLTTIRDAVGKLGVLSGHATRTLQVDHAMETMRRSTLRYKLDSNEASLQAGTEAAAKSIELLEAASKDAVSEARRSAYGALAGNVRSILQKRDELVDTTKKLLADKQSLFTVGDEVTATTGRLVSTARASNDPAVAGLAAAVESNVLLVRIANWRFQATQDPQGPANFKAGLDKANGAIAALEQATTLPDIRAVIPAVRTALARYGASFESYSVKLLKGNELFDKELVPQTVEVQKQIADAATSLNAEFEATKVATDGSIGSTITLQEIIAGVALLLGVSIAYVIGRGIVRPLYGLTQALAKLASGEFGTDVPGIERKDEIGQIARAVDTLKIAGAEQARAESEKATVEAENRRVLEENTRIRVALDSCSTNVMVADNNYTIVYMNKAVTDMMRDAEAELRQELKHFDVNKLIGTNIDTFHKNPAHQRSMLERLSGVYRTSISVAGRSFNLTANPVLDGKGARLGSVVEWHDVTLERRVESEIDKVVNAAVNGNFREAISLEGKQGFMRTLAEALNRMCKSVADALDDVNTNLTAMSQGDLTKRITATYAGMFEELKNNCNGTAEKLSEIVTEVVVAANEVTSASTEITTGTNDLSQRTEQQASNLEETASSMEQMASTVKQNADNAAQANQLAISARTVATDGGGIVGKAVEAMSRIEASSQKISDIIGVIDEIAFQTNLLALNAAVEAARAGDAGKGFAVVASEVRSLAQRSSEAAKDIKALIVESGGQVKDGVKLVNDAGGSLTDIVDSIKRVADIISEITAASKEQSTGIEEINNAVSQMDEVTQQNSALVEQNAAASRTLQEQAQNMLTRMSFFAVDNAGRSERPRPASRPAAPPSAKPATRPAPTPVRRPVAKVAAAGGAAKMQAELRSAIESDPDWKEF